MVLRCVTHSKTVSLEKMPNIMLTKLFKYSQMAPSYLCEQLLIDENSLRNSAGNLFPYSFSNNKLPTLQDDNSFSVYWLNQSNFSTIGKPLPNADYMLRSKNGIAQSLDEDEF